MSITADQATAVAKRHGLSLSDAQALATLADGEAHADILAAQFAAQDSQPKASHGKEDGHAEAARRFGTDPA